MKSSHKKRLWLLQTINSKSGRDSSSPTQTQRVYSNFGFLVLQILITVTPHTVSGSGSVSGLQLCCVLQTLAESGPCCRDGGPRYTLQLALNCSVNRCETRKHQFCRCPSFYLQLWFSALRGQKPSSARSELQTETSQTSPQIPADVSAPTQIWFVRVRRVIGSVWILWFLALFLTSARRFAQISRVQLPPHDLQVLVEDLRSVSVPRPPWSQPSKSWSCLHQLSGLGLYSVWTCLSLRPGSVLIYSTRGSQEPIYICGVFRGVGF